jgi:hypothetical protein
MSMLPREQGKDHRSKRQQHTRHRLERLAAKGDAVARRALWIYAADGYAVMQDFLACEHHRTNGEQPGGLKVEPGQLPPGALVLMAQWARENAMFEAMRQERLDREQRLQSSGGEGRR